jgi:hypothetical protein
MDKLAHATHNTTKEYRKGFALLLTLSILAIVIALSSVLVEYISKVDKNTIKTKALLQSDILYSDIQRVLKNFSSKKEELYQTLYTTPMPFTLPDNRFSVLLKCKPLANGININWIAYDQNDKMQNRVSLVYKVFDYIVQKYEIQNANKLIDMLTSYIKNSQDIYGNNKANINEILSKDEFETIIFNYFLEENDNSVINVPWDKFFVFNPIKSNTNNNIIDANYMSVELISALFDIDTASLEEEWSEGGDLKQLLSNYGITLNDKIYYTKFYPYSRCEVYYDYKSERFRFDFDDIDNEVKNFEFYGKQ